MGENHGTRTWTRPAATYNCRSTVLTYLNLKWDKILTDSEDVVEAADLVEEIVVEVVVSVVEETEEASVEEIEETSVGASEEVPEEPSEALSEERELKMPQYTVKSRTDSSCGYFTKKPRQLKKPK